MEFEIAGFKMADAGICGGVQQDFAGKELEYFRHIWYFV